MNLEQRIIELETRLAYQEQTLSELNEVLAEQLRRQSRLEQALALLRQHVQSLPVPETDDAPPPHY